MEGLYGLIFDVDGVIADTEAVNARASSLVFERMFGLCGVRREDFVAGLGRGAEEYMKAAARVHGIEFTGEQLVAACRQRQVDFLELLEQQPLPAFPGVLDLMNEALARDDVRLAIATSGTREKSEAVLKSAGIPYREMAYVAGDEVSRKKPDPELFLTAALRMGVSAGNCLVIEDAPNGIEAAHAAGFRCLAVTNSCPRQELDAADRIVDSLSEVRLASVLELVA
jgi:beta-phosphoglucomutase